MRLHSRDLDQSQEQGNNITMGTVGVILPSNNTILESYLQHLYDVNQEKKKHAIKRYELKEA